MSGLITEYLSLNEESNNPYLSTANTFCSPLYRYFVKIMKIDARIGAAIPTFDVDTRILKSVLQLQKMWWRGRELLLVCWTRVIPYQLIVTALITASVQRNPKSVGENRWYVNKIRHRLSKCIAYSISVFTNIVNLFDYIEPFIF